jgi:hypothetical protein
VHRLFQLAHFMEETTMQRTTMQRTLTKARLRRQNRLFAGTTGVSSANRGLGFLPAFRDRATGRTVIARYADGRPAPVHLLDGVPAEWVAARDRSGNVMAVKPTVVAGFVRRGIFYTREQASRAADA